MHLAFVVLACSDPPVAPDDPPPPEHPLDQIELPGDRLYPEGIAAADDGTLYVGSLETGAIVTAPPGAELATYWLPGGLFEPRGIMGLEVDDVAGVLWFCSSEFTKDSVLEGWDIATVTELYSYPLPAGGFCNDSAIGPDGSVYATDSFGGMVFRVPPDRSALEAWGPDPQPAAAGELGLNGIAVVGATVYAVRFDVGGLLGWPITTDGSAGPAFRVTLDAEIGSPDGLDVYGDVLVAVEGQADRLVIPDVAGTEATVTPIPVTLSTPTTLAVVGDDAWVVEGQLGARRSGEAVLPFVAVRVPLSLD